MLSDTASIPADTILRADVCIIGAGPAGITVALELAGSGLEVLLLESGGARPERRPQALARGQTEGVTYYRLERSRIRAFGGTSNHWLSATGMRARPLDALDFSARPEIGRDGWPIGRDDLDAAYQRAQEICRLGPFDYSIGHWADTAGLATLPLGRHAETVSFQSGPIENFPDRLSELATSPGVHVVLHATAVELLVDDLGTRVERVNVAGSDGRRLAAEAGVVVLAGGGIDNARLLLLSQQRSPAGLGNDHDLVGRFFMEHPHVRTGTVRLREGANIPALGLYKRTALAGTQHVGMVKPTDDVLVRERLLASAWMLHPSDEVHASAAARALPDLADVVRHRRLLPGTGRRLADVMRQPDDVLRAAIARVRRRDGARPGVLKMSMMLEQRPDRESRVTLGAERDALGQPRAHVRWRLSELEHASISGGQRVLDRAFRDADLGHVEDFYDRSDTPPALVGGYHHIGTTRMAPSARDGVVDVNGKLHGVTNCYVTGSSVFPTAGYANPTLTVVAVAARLGAHLRTSLRRRADIGGR